MADKRAEITNINLESGNLNLDDEEIQITQYEGFNHKNSMFLGGQLKNWYKKKFEVPFQFPGSKIIQKWKDHVIWQDGAGVIYKDDTPIYSFEPFGFKIEDVTNEWIRLGFFRGNSTNREVKFKIFGDKINIKFKFDGVDKEFVLELSGLYSFSASNEISTHGDTVYVTLFNRNGYLTMYYDPSKDQFIQDSSIIIYDRVQEIGKVDVTGSRKTYDCVCITGDDKTTHRWCNYPSNKNSFSFQEILDSSGGSTGGWSKGRKVKTTCRYSRYKDGVQIIPPRFFYALYYNFEQTGISYNDSVIVNNIDSILFLSSQVLYYRDSERRIKKLSIVDTPYIECQPIIKDRYLLLNTTSYLNTIDLETNKVFCRSDDYNDRCRVEMSDSSGSLNFVATSWNEQVETKQDTSFSTVYPARLQRGRSVSSVKPYIPGENITHEINVYVSDRDGLTTPTYNNSWDIGLDQIKTNFDLSGMYYPMNSYPLYNTSVTAKFNDIYLNYALVDEGGYSFITQIDQYQNMIFGYYPTTYIQLSNLFVIQGTIYGINNQYIVAINVSNSSISGVNVVCNKSDMQYIGSTPKSALFYSPMDRSIYLFTGDQSMVKAYDCNKVGEIYSFYNNPSTGFILISTDVGIIGIYNDQIFSMDDVHYEDYIYYTNNNYVIGDVEYSPYKKDGYELIPIILETKFYGVSNEIKSINDCVYLRIFSEEEEPRGTVKVWCETLNDVSVKSQEKVFQITKNLFDSNTKSMFIRYQPKFQEATGFRVHVESDFSICSMSISHKMEAVQNSKYNL